jgi:hypothetical protein
MCSARSRTIQQLLELPNLGRLLTPRCEPRGRLVDHRHIVQMRGAELARIVLQRGISLADLFREPVQSENVALGHLGGGQEVP